MDTAIPEDTTGPPRIGLQQVSRRPADHQGQWVVGWSVQNLGAEPLALDAAWLPHRQFRGERTDLRPSPTLDPGEATELQLLVRWDEPPESVVENAFLILTVRWRDEPWRILARVTVGVDPHGAPDAQTQNMTIQRIGFSGVPR